MLSKVKRNINKAKPYIIKKPSSVGISTSFFEDENKLIDLINENKNLSKNIDRALLKEAQDSLNKAMEDHLCSLMRIRNKDLPYLHNVSHETNKRGPRT